MTDETIRQADPPRDRALRKEVVVDAPVEAVWQALTDAEELKRWFPLDARVEPGPGGAIWLSWGPGVEGEGAIDVWEPGRRLRWVEGGDGPVRMLVDFHLEARGGSTMVRLVQSGFGPGEDWDAYYDATDGGWTYFLWHLRFYLSRHHGRDRHLAWVRRPTAADHGTVWRQLTGPDGLGLVDAPPADLPRGLEQEQSFYLTPGHESTGRIVVWRPATHLAVTVAELNDGILFAELEPGGDRWHLGLWLSTYGLDDASGQRSQTRVEALAERILSPLEKGA